MYANPRRGRLQSRRTRDGLCAFGADGERRRIREQVGGSAKKGWIAPRVFLRPRGLNPKGLTFVPLKGRQPRIADTLRTRIVVLLENGIN